MFSWDKNFRSFRDDGRHVTTLAADMCRLRKLKPELTFDKNFSKEQFVDWQIKVKAKLTELMQFPPFTEQPCPKLINECQRDGYKVQRWEFYPEDWSVVPVLILIPDGVSEDNPAPGVLCFPGSNTCKELLAGELLMEHPNYDKSRFSERNMMAKHYVEAGLIAVAFDNPGTGELAEQDELADGEPAKETQWDTRVKLCGELICSGRNYLGLSVFQKVRFLEWFKQQKWVDASRLAVCGHSLGSEVSMVLGVIDDDITAIVHNDFLCDERRRKVSVTNLDESSINDGGNWHHVPGLWKWFNFPDLLVSMAPKCLVINEGGPSEFLNLVRAGYKIMDAEENYTVNYYPKYMQAESRKHDDELLPEEDLSWDEFWEYAVVDASDHSFRVSYSIPWIKTVFNL
jgi:Abhydrolase family